MLVGLGHDLQAVHELASAESLQEPGAFFTARETERFARSRSPQESLAAAFCAKEALFKALPPLEGWFWTDAEVLHDARHAPQFVCHGALAEAMARHGWQPRLSISHSGGFVSAVVLVVAAPAA